MLLNKEEFRTNVKIGGYTPVLLETEDGRIHEKSIKILNPYSPFYYVKACIVNSIKPGMDRSDIVVAGLWEDHELTIEEIIEAAEENNHSFILHKLDKLYESEPVDIESIKVRHVTSVISAWNRGDMEEATRRVKESAHFFANIAISDGVKIEDLESHIQKEFLDIVDDLTSLPEEEERIIRESSRITNPVVYKLRNIRKVKTLEILPDGKQRLVVTTMYKGTDRVYEITINEDDFKD